jgi:hypothetical protein
MDARKRAYSSLRATPAVGVIHDVVGCTNERKTGQSKATQMKSRRQGMIT